MRGRRLVPLVDLTDAAVVDLRIAVVVDFIAVVDVDSFALAVKWPQSAYAGLNFMLQNQ